MMVLARHWAKPSHLPEQPLHDDDTPAESIREKRSRFLRQIDQDGAGLEDRDRRAAVLRLVIDDGRHAVVRGNGQEFRPELLALADVDGHDPMRKPSLLEKDRDLV